MIIQRTVFRIVAVKDHVAKIGQTPTITVLYYNELFSGVERIKKWNIVNIRHEIEVLPR